MRVNHLLSAILRGPFALQHETVLAYLPRVATMLRGEGEQGELPKPKVRSLVVVAGTDGLMAATVASRQRVKAYDDAPAGSVAIHSLKGVMMKQDQWGLCEDTPGTASLTRALVAADAHENVVAHVLDIDSGGGTVDGTAEFAATIKGLTKPIVAYSDGIVASAAYWAASACQRIVLNNSTCAVGSIGVMCSITDYKPMLEELGVKFHEPRADDSDEKNEDFYQLLQGNYKPYVTNVLNPLREMFASTVKQNRPQLATKDGEKLLRGSMYFAETATASGLVDEIGPFSRAVELALELAAGDSGSDAGTSATSLTTNTMFGKNKFPAVAALAGLQGAAMTPALVSAANDELEAANITAAALISQTAFDELTAKAGRVDQAEATVKATTDALAAAGAKDVAELIAQRDEARTTAEEYGNQPGELPTSSEKIKSDVEESAETPDKEWEAIHARMLNS
ncbi:S49 family peptidase [Hymenobacter sp. ASUV-10]|uniref:S49 family peptidase n=1 Tax=Hymenobacter aranciens TaxID=3063996 RepID=A0ABT9BCM1_9BACT|nr:S49 family peptidase [Hymenobacter sp. ASUV-10]MDO7876007.1 S49 family peptidase [Hymenobacter sp. ASUV-10]